MALKLSEIDDLSRFDHQYLTPDDRCFFFGEYTPRLGYEGSKTNDLILNFKKPLDRKNKPQWKYKEETIERIAEVFKRSLNVEKLQKVTLVPIPPSKVKGDPLYDDRMLRVLEKLGEKWNKRLDTRELILQRRSTPADHTTEFRQDLQDLIENYYIDEKLVNPRPERIILFDDILTTGKHFAAAKQVLEKQYPGIEILGVFVARNIRPEDGV